MIRASAVHLEAPAVREITAAVSIPSVAVRVVGEKPARSRWRAAGGEHGNEEDRGGWSVRYNDAVMGSEMGKGMGRADLLLGRRTYEGAGPRR